MKRYIYITLITTALYQGSVSAVAELPDPTRPADYYVAPVTVEVYELPKELIDWNVSAIRIKDSDKSAIVNGQLVRTGDQIGSATVLEIKPVAVVLNYENKHVVVRLFGDSVDKKARINSNVNKN